MQGPVGAGAQDLETWTLPLAHMQVPVTLAWGDWSPSRSLSCPPRAAFKGCLEGNRAFSWQGLESPSQNGEAAGSERKGKQYPGPRFREHRDWDSVPGLRRSQAQERDPIHGRPCPPSPASGVVCSPAGGAGASSVLGPELQRGWERQGRVSRI